MSVVPLIIWIRTKALLFIKSTCTSNIQLDVLHTKVCIKHQRLRMYHLQVMKFQIR